MNSTGPQPNLIKLINSFEPQGKLFPQGGFTSLDQVSFPCLMVP